MAISNYLINREPSRFGNKQAEYIVQSKKIIAEGTVKVQKVISEKGDLKKAFFPLSDFLRKERHAFAIANGTENAAHFEIKRNSIEAYDLNMGYAYTALTSHAYSEYGNKMLNFLQKRLAEMSHTACEFYQKKQEKREPDCLGRRSDFEIEIHSSEDIEKLGWHKPPDYSKSMKAIQIAEDKNLNSYEKMQALKKEEPTFYKHDRMHFYLRALQGLYPDKHGTHYVLATMRLQINGKRYPISQYLTSMHCNGKDDPIGLMTGKPEIIIIHLDSLLLDEPLNDIASLFEKSVQWKRREGIRELKDRVGLLRYEHNHTMPNYRGSEAVSEYLENIIYGGIHGLDLKYVEDKSVGLESLTLPLAEFMKVYHDSVVVTERVNATN